MGLESICTCDILMRICSQAGVHIHSQTVQLSQGIHRAEQHDDNPASLYCLNSPSQQIWCQCLKVLSKTQE